MKFYKIRYRTTDKIKTVQILAESPTHAKQIFKQSNPFVEIVTVVLAWSGRLLTKEAKSQTTAVALVQASHTIPIVIIEIKQVN